jgi:peptide chain release factor
MSRPMGGRMSSAPVSPAKVRDLERKMEMLGIREDDIEESFVRASGPGGQKVNKTSSCVVLKHKPTGVIIKCMESRSRELNRFLARRRLVDRIAEQEDKALSERQEKIEKIRRQKRRRTKRAKEKMLADKKALSQKKSLRRTPRHSGDAG